MILSESANAAENGTRMGPFHQNATMADHHATSPLPTLILVDDDVLIADALSFSLRRNFDIRCAQSRAEALRLIDESMTPPAAALVDLGLPPVPHRPDEGFALIREILARSPTTRILVLSGQNDEANARHARTLGAIDFVAKPCDPATLLDRLQQAIALDRSDARPPTTGLIGQSPSIQKLRAQVAQYADSPFPVLIEGESGCGKEIVARDHLHAHTARANRPFLALNCAAIAPTLVEPTLFGHAKGAFTGATGARPGYFEEVGDGTLFLDEIGELPLDLQAKLLRVLENGEFQRVGETQTRRSAARIVAATNRDLRDEVRAGRFRNDLFHRLSVFTISVPPLREMGNDRLLLLDHLRGIYANLSGKPPFALTPEALVAWQRYRFPGNVRELRNIVIRLSAKYPGQAVGAAALDDEFDLGVDSGKGLSRAALPASPAEWKDLATDRLRGGDAFELDALLHEIEQGFIDAAIELERGNVSQAARRLGLSRTTLYSRMENKTR
jgi:DNA-binding NtrC family response regulator